MRELISAGRIVEFEAGETLIAEGDCDTSVYILLSSFVKITARLNDGVGEALLAVRFGGDVVGELAATDGRTRSATVKACGRAPVITTNLDRSALTGVLAQDPDGMLIFAATISEKLRSATRRRVDYTGCTTRVRLARVLVELAAVRGETIGKGTIIGVDLTQLELGTLVGVKQAAAERAMRDLRVAGLIDTNGRRPLVRDMVSLRLLAEQPAAGTDLSIAIE